MRSLIAFVLLAALVQQAVTAFGVMGIDFGTDWFKVGVVKPGIPLDLVLNKESKRKTEALVTVHDNIRNFGTDSVTMGLRYPRDSYAKIKNLLGKRFDDPEAVAYRQTYDNTMIKDPRRGTVAFKDGENVYTAEELTGMILAHAKQQCEEFAGEPIRDVVFTVPPFWKQHERKALLDAADLAGLRVMTLLNDETAVALNYGMSRNFEEKPQYHIFYDIGAGSTVASLIEFRQTTEKEGKTNKDVTLIEVKGVGYDRTLGGHEFDVRLQRLLAKKFVEGAGKKAQSDINKSQKALAKLLKEANRIKHILSANTDTTANVEGLIDEIDFKAQVTRVELEKISADLFERLEGPIKDVLAQSGMKMSDVQSFILVGGGSRVPAIIRNLETIVGAEKIAKHVNSDEAAVMGASLWGAALSPSFRVRNFKIKDITAHPIIVSFAAERKEGAEERTIRQKLFKEYSAVDVKKKLTFKRGDDISVHVGFETTWAAKDPGDEKKGEEDKDKKAEEVPAATNDTNSTAKANETKIEVPKAIEHSLPLQVNITYLGIEPLNADEKQAIRKRNAEMDAQDRLRKARAEARNNLEAFVYTTQDALESAAIKHVSTEPERQSLSEKLSAMSEWLYDDGDMPTTPTDEFIKRLADLKKVYDPITFRKSELEKRGDAVARLKKAVATAQSFLFQHYTNVTADDRLYSDEDAKTFGDTLTKTETWLKEKQEAQKKLTDHETPVLVTSDLQLKVYEVSTAQRLFKLKKKSKVTVTPTPTKTEQKPTSTATATEESTETPDEPVETPNEENPDNQETDKPQDEGHDEL